MLFHVWGRGKSVAAGVGGKCLFWYLWFVIVSTSQLRAEGGAWEMWVHLLLQTAHGPELCGVREGGSGTQRRRLQTLSRETPRFKDSEENEKKGEKRDWKSDWWGRCDLLSSPSFWNVTGMFWTWVLIVRLLCSRWVVCGWSVSFFLLHLLSSPRSVVSVVSYMLASQAFSVAFPWGPGLVSWVHLSVT